MAIQVDHRRKISTLYKHYNTLYIHMGTWRRLRISSTTYSFIIRFSLFCIIRRGWVRVKQDGRWEYALGAIPQLIQQYLGEFRVYRN